ncbi:hypothetical protein NRIC_12290 [Enterococcus florum]|uniref:Uncharacterized protein n=1 Tax=Enterococcus florum TaxID=2480627 RepID=A0A4P5PBM1_9ENTE|nr:hypothetical protein [Enterococcus florum]GCF93338.1 hypothetical protein NRIC_12290 [Enterococcus florum]
MKKRKLVVCGLSLLIVCISSLSASSLGTFEGGSSLAIAASKKKKDPNTDMRKQNTYKEGSYLIGQDAPEGEYLIVSAKNFLESRKDFYFGSYTIYSDANKTAEIESSNINVPIEDLTKDSLFSKAKFKKKTVNEFSADLVYLKSGQFIELGNTKMYPSEYREKVNAKKLFEGTYKVGRDIPTGTYKTEAFNPDGGETLHTIRIMNSVDPSLGTSSWIKFYQDYSDETYPQNITLNEGEYVSFSDLILKLKKNN